MKRIAVHLLAVAARRQVRRTPLPSRPSNSTFARPSLGHESNIRSIRRKLSAAPSKAVSAITSAARLSRFWRQRDARRSGDSSREHEGANQDEAIQMSMTADTLRDALSEEDLFPCANPPNSPATSVEIMIDQRSGSVDEKPLSRREPPSVGLGFASLVSWTAGLAGSGKMARSRSLSMRGGAVNAPLQRARSLPANKLSASPRSNLFSSLGSLAHICAPSTSHKSLVASATMLSLTGAGDYLLEPRMPPSPTGMFVKLALPVVGIFSGSASPAASLVSILPSPWSMMAVPEAIPLLEVKHLVRDAVSLLPVDPQ
ncbi:unnamed protein product [Peniophora sp. CBMAI 1063]|nr:unnamed protein product [Peniophora sp. CBMAI 1063]